MFDLKARQQAIIVSTFLILVFFYSGLPDFFFPLSSPTFQLDFVQLFPDLDIPLEHPKKHCLPSFEESAPQFQTGKFMGDGLGYSIQLTYSKLDSSDINFTLITHSAASYLPSNPRNFYLLLLNQCYRTQRWYSQNYLRS